MTRFLLLAVALCFSVTAAAPEAFAGTSKYMGRNYIAKKHRHLSRANRAPQVDRYAHIVIDAQSGFVLSEKNADKRLYPASLSKMMTLYLTFEAIENGSISKYKRVPVSANAEYQPPSKLGLEAGYSIRVEDAILALVTRSANDAAVVLADAVGGSESRFARMMTLKAAALGMRNTHFVNASGLHDPEQYSSARDMAILGQALMRDYPRYYRYFSTPSFTYAGVTSLNHNHLMASYPGMDGIKTGYVNASGYNLVASAVQNGHRLIGVVFGGRTSNTRNTIMRDLLDDGFRSIQEPRVATLIQKRLDAARAGMPRKKPGAEIAAAKTNTAEWDAVRTQPVTARTQTSLDAPAFRSMGLATEEGDTEEADEPDAPAAAAAIATAPAPAAGNQPADNKVVELDAGKAFATDFKPRPMNTGTLAVQPPKAAAAPVKVAAAQTAMPQVVSGAVKSGWSVQIGAYNTQHSGMQALKSAHDRLPKKLTANSQYVISPLQTNRGMIYRARLSGLSQSQANSACKVLRGSCLVMAQE